MPSDNKSSKLLHVQNGVIRKLLYTHVTDEDLKNRYRLVMERETKKDIKEALQRVEKAKLIEIINKSPEITEEHIELCFEENRYNNRPNFRLFHLQSLDPQTTSASFIQAHKEDKAIKKLNQRLRDVSYSNDNVTSLIAVDQTIIDPQTLEIAFKYNEKYNFIDPETEQNEFIYELKYGFMWINFDQRYVNINLPSDLLVGTLSSVAEETLACLLIPVNITKSIVERVFPKDSMKRTTLSTATSGKIEKITLADKELGNKVSQNPEYEGYDSPSSVYQEAINEDGELYSTLGVNSEKGKIYLTRQLKASDMRRWGLWRIGQIMSHMNSIHTNGDIDEKFDAFGIAEDSEVKTFAYGQDEKKAIVELMKALVICKKQGIESYRLLIEKPEKLVAALKKHMNLRFRPYCDGCQEHADLVCPSCGKFEIMVLSRKGQSTTVKCGFCSEDIELDQLTCLMSHKVRVNSWYDGVLMYPNTALTSLMQRMIKKYFPEVDFMAEEEQFHLSNNVLHYSANKSSRVMYRVEEIPELEKVWGRRISNQRREDLQEVMELLKEKCSKQSSDACKACQKEHSIRCVMKPFITFTNHHLHPHHGQEYGDISFNMKMLNMDDAVFVGIAKSYEKKEITSASDKGREMLEQFYGKCTDTMTHVIGIVVAGHLEQGFTAKLQDLARRYNKKVVMWTYNELLMAVDYAIHKYGLSIENIIIDLKADGSKRRGRPKNVS
ncbi:hypothetical protein [Paenibacillus monticola]|uniref:Uncharacterized protein n=1 Tax=Paenibacillus monticola TaxID=2666075 RepID=A0A7X2L0W8_9BACL|nr:hypothetical protein [Paenibacillus monticola]MRN52749.1 hypothetical protein [Paenibacillus monticola]